MNAIIYVNAPLSEDEHKSLVKIATKEGRSKGQQLRALAVQAMGLNPSKKRRARK